MSRDTRGDLSMRRLPRSKPSARRSKRFSSTHSTYSGDGTARSAGKTARQFSRRNTVPVSSRFLVDFAQKVERASFPRLTYAKVLKVRHTPQYLDVELNGGMTVAKYAARFELGLTTTVRSTLAARALIANRLTFLPGQTPTVTFPRNIVLGTPDLNSDSLKMSIPAMRVIRNRLIERYSDSPDVDIATSLPGTYLPSCIRRTVQLHSGSPPVNMVWRLDYASDETSTEPRIELRPCGTARKTVARPIFKFQLTRKDGTTLEVRVPDKLKAVWTDGAPVREGEEVVMTDGCSFMSPAVSSVYSFNAESGRKTEQGWFSLATGHVQAGRKARGVSKKHGSQAADPRSCAGPYRTG